MTGSVADTVAGTPVPLAVVVVIARYPPHHLGGYELRCRDVCRELVRRGHTITVRVHRTLHLWPQGVQGTAAIFRFIRETASDCRRLRRAARNASVVAYWHQSGLSSALLAVRPPRPCGVVCDVSSEWLLDAAQTGGNWFRIWERPSRSGFRGLIKGALRTVAALIGAPVTRPSFPPGRAYFTSEERRRVHLDAGVRVEGAALIRSGIDLGLFPFRPDRPATPRTILFLGRLKRRKGLHTAVLALGYLPSDVHLRVVGAPEDPSYLAELGELVSKTGVSDRVRIGEPVDHAAVAGHLHAAHALVFPCEQPEAFSRLVLEAFACGTPVVGTTLGGTAEVLIDGETGLTHAPGNARQLADQIARVLSDAALRERIVAGARELVTSRYALGWTVDQIEELLRDARARATA